MSVPPALASGVNLARMGLQTVVSGTHEAAVLGALEALRGAGATVLVAPRRVGEQWVAVCEGVPEAGAYRW